MIAAAQTISELVRRLNHATRSDTAFEYPSQLGQTVESIHEAVTRLDQLFHQIDARLTVFESDPALYAAGGGQVGETVAVAHHALEGALQGVAALQQVLAWLSKSLGRLGLNDDDSR